MRRTAITNIGTLLSGVLDRPVVEADTVLLEGETIAAVGNASDFDLSDVDVLIDARGTTCSPGLVDSHVHNVIGDYSPRQKTVDFLESYVHGAITTSITASEVHAPGRPTDPAGVKALAIAAERCFRNYRPGGMKVYAGSVILEPGLTAADFDEMAAQGVRLAKAGMGNFHPPKDVAPLVRLAQARGMVVMLHTGGASIPGSAAVTDEDVLAIQPDVVGHVNGGPTALTDEGLKEVVAHAKGALQVVQAGNLRSALLTCELLHERNELQRLLIASDTPTGTGMMPLAVLKSVVELASLGPLSAVEAFCAATGNPARAYGIPEGTIAPGRPADVVLLDAPLGSAFADALSAAAGGDLPGIGAAITAGQLRYVRSRNSPPATRMPVVRKEHVHIFLSEEN